MKLPFMTTCHYCLEIWCKSEAFHFGKDMKVDLSGGKIGIITKNGSELVCPLKYEDHDCAYVTISTNADFSTEVVYVVKVLRGESRFVEYPIQTIDIGVT